MDPGRSAETATPPAAWLKDQRSLSGRWITLGVGLSFFSGLLLILQAWLLARTIHAVVFADASLDQVGAWLWSLFVVFVLRAALGWASEQAAFHAAARVKIQVRDRVFRHLAALGPARLGAERTGEIVTALSDGMEALEAYYARYLPAMTLMVLLPLAILVVALPLDWLSALILLVTAPLIPLFMILIGKGTEKLNQRQWRTLARLSAHFLEVIQGLTTLKLFNASRREIDNVARISDDYRRSTMAVLRVAFLSSLALEFFATVSIAVVAVSIGFRLLWGQIDFLHGFFVLLLAPEFYLPLRSMGTHYHARMEAIGAAERLLHVLEIQPATPPERLATVPDLREAPIHLEDIVVEFEDGTRALDGLDLDIRPGERLAIVGASGAGKSTLFNLLLGFVEPSAGRLSVGDVALRDLDPDRWRQQLSWVPQRPHLYAGSVAVNIRLGRPDAGDADVEQAAVAAQASAFITGLVDGFSTPIGEGGVGLSGGQAQRIALARAFLRQAPLLLLDEPTASLDAENETKVQAAVDRLAEGRTLVIIAHRLNTVHSADRIVLLDQGRVRAQGTHAQLLASCPSYRRLVDDFGNLG